MKKIWTMVILILLTSALFTACSQQAPIVSLTPTQTSTVISTATPTPAQPPFEIEEKTAPAYGFDDPIWWKHAVFYEIFVRSFYDSDGDGIGDFKGITAKLDYLNDGDPSTTDDLGVNALWLMPIFPSPSYHGYDVTDYLNVNPEYGTMEDFNKLLKEAHKRGIHVIIDFVINHTSSEHPWFKAAQNTSSEYHDWYIWSKTNPGYIGPWGETVWHQAANGLYYYGIFWSGMPDLNYQNTAVTAQIQDIASYWINTVGVDGFRIDAIKHLVEEGEVQANTRPTFEWFSAFKALYKSWNPAVMSVGETWDSSIMNIEYLKADSIDMAFDFDLASAIISNVRSSAPVSLSRAVTAESNIYGDYSRGIFLTNHDMDRAMSQLGGDVQKAKHAVTILLTVPGTPFLYYGEEIGMEGVKPDEQLRSPMQWAPGEGSGFTSGTSWEAVNTFSNVNVANQLEDEDSLLSLYRELIHMRLKFPAFLDGEYIQAEVSNAALYAGIVRKDDEILLTIVNMKDVAVDKPTFKVKSGISAGVYKMKVLIGSDELASELEVIQSGDSVLIKFPYTIAAQQDLVIQLAFIP